MNKRQIGNYVIIGVTAALTGLLFAYGTYRAVKGPVDKIRNDVVGEFVEEGMKTFKEEFNPVYSNAPIEARSNAVDKMFDDLERRVIEEKKNGSR